MLMAVAFTISLVACNIYELTLDEVNTTIYEVDEDMNDIDLYAIDVRVFIEVISKFVIDLILERTPEYPYVCNLSDFVFKDGYSGFIVTNIDLINESEMSVYFRLESNENEDDFDAIVLMNFHESQLANQEAIRQRAFLGSAAPIPAVFASQLDIGDFAFDGTVIEFIRGNVYVDVRRLRMDDMNVDITNLARGIDQQILNIIAGASEDH